MARKVSTFPLGPPALPPGGPKGRWVVEALRSAIREGRLAPGDRMPGSRDLAGQWGLSRGLVNAAYEELQAEGLIESVVGSGTFVSAKGVLPSPPVDMSRVPLRDHPAWVRLNPEKPFIARETDVSRFPVGIWKTLASRTLSVADRSFFYDPDPAGLSAFRAEVARYLGFARGIRCGPEDIVITTGIRHGLDLCLRCVARPGEDVWTEEPGYAGAQALIRLNRLNAVPVPVDEDGMQIDVAERMAPEARLAILTPSHQSPLGVRLSVERRQALLAWAERRDGFIFEDDYDGEFAFDTARAPALKAMDAQGRVIHAGSFTKILFPTLRIGYLVVPPPLRARIRQAREETGRSNSATDQSILAQFIAGGHLAHHIRLMGRVYEEKCALAVRSIEEGFGAPVEILGRHAGFHFFLLLPERVDVETLQAHGAARGLTLQAASLHREHHRKQGLIIGYSSLSLSTIAEAGHTLGSILRAVERQAPTARRSLSTATDG